MGGFQNVAFQGKENSSHLSTRKNNWQFETGTNCAENHVGLIQHKRTRTKIVLKIIDYFHLRRSVENH